MKKFIRIFLVLSSLILIVISTGCKAKRPTVKYGIVFEEHSQSIKFHT
ncbi:MAG: hypothetical protein ABIJ97_09740 [Bacteroidota bacterium]